MSMANIIQEKLTAALQPVRIDVVDESHLHAGHAGAPAGGNSHFRVEIVAQSFDGLSRVERQRLVYQILAEELRGGVHALALTTRSPDEDARSAQKP